MTPMQECILTEYIKNLEMNSDLCLLFEPFNLCLFENGRTLIKTYVRSCIDEQVDALVKGGYNRNNPFSDYFNNLKESIDLCRYITDPKCDWNEIATVLHRLHYPVSLEARLLEFAHIPDDLNNRANALYPTHVGSDGSVIDWKAFLLS